MNFPSGLTAQPLKLERRGNAGDSAADHQDVGRVGSAMTQANAVASSTARSVDNLVAARTRALPEVASPRAQLALPQLSVQSRCR